MNKSKKIWELFWSAVLFPALYLISYFYLLVMNILFFFIFFEWNYADSKEKLNIPEFGIFYTSVWADIKELWNEQRK